MCAQIVDSGFFGWRGENFHELQIRATTLAVMVDDICRRNIRLPTYVYVYFRWLAAGTLSFWQRSRERELRIKYAFQRRMRFFNWDCSVCVRYAHLAANLCMSATTRQQRNADQKKKKEHHHHSAHRRNQCSATDDGTTHAMRCDVLRYDRCSFVKMSFVLSQCTGIPNPIK